MSKKLMRSFRLPADLIERFDKAVEKDGVDKTEIIVNAIKEYVDLHDLSGVFGDSFIHVSEIYVPVLGKCKVWNGGVEDRTNPSFDLDVINCDRKDEEGYKYRIDNVIASVDFINRTCEVAYKKVYYGGYVEDGNKLRFSIRWNVSYPFGSKKCVDLVIFPV